MRKANRIWAACFAALLLVLLPGCGQQEDPVPEIRSPEGISCLEYSSYSGPFPEDGSYREVSDVAAIRVRNDSDDYLEFARIRCAIGSGEGSFVVSGIPPGTEAWVLEESGMPLKPSDLFRATGYEQLTFNPDAVVSDHQIEAKYEDGKVTVTNHSDETREALTIYYKSVHTDGRWFGGITYRLSCGTLQPGASVSLQTGHFSGNSKIVRCSWEGGSG